MTQNTPYSGAISNDKRESNDHPESNEIRADIDQTRASVGDKIDQLQARLDPNKLMQQAQETVQEMLTDTANSMTEYVRTHRDDMVTSLADAARRNPLPTALVGLGVGWLILESMAGGKNRESDTRSDKFTDEYVDYRPSTYPADSKFQGQQRAGDGKQQGNPLQKAVNAVKNTVGDVTDEIKDRVSDAGHEIKDRVSEVKDRMDDAKDSMGDTAGGVRRQAGDMGEQTQHSLQRAGDQIDQWQQRARDEGQRRGQRVMRNLEDNPLTYGAVALAAGVALAILLPQTRTENRVFGEARDQLMEKGQEVVETTKEHAQQIASEMRPELEEKARKLVNEVKEVAHEAKEELRPVMDKAMAKTKEEARSAAQELGVNPDKLTSGSSMGSSSTSSSSPSGKSTSGASMGSSTTGTATMTGTSTSGSSMADKSQSNKPVINRDTMRGQWQQLKGDVKSKWGQLTDDELTRVEGDYEKLVGVLQTRYGYARGRAEQEINDFFNSRKT